MCELTKSEREKYFNLLEKSSNEFKQTQNPDAAKNIVVAYYKLQEYKITIKKIEIARNLTKGVDYNAELTQYLANCYGKEGNHTKAISCYEELIQTGVRKWVHGGHMGLGIVFMRQGKMSGDKILLEKALEKFRLAWYDNIKEIEVASIHINIAEVYQILGQHEKAIENYKKAIPVTKRDWKIAAYNGLAISLAHVERFKDSHDILDEAYNLALAKEDGIALANNLKARGIVYRESNDNFKAYEFLNQAKKLYRSKELFIELAEVCYILGDELEKQSDQSKAAKYKAEHKFYSYMIKEGGVN